MRPLLIPLLLLCILLDTADAGACVAPLIKGAVGQHNYDANTGILTCKDDKKEIAHDKIRYYELKCWDETTKTGWWTTATPDKQRTTNLAEGITIECKQKACKTWQIKDFDDKKMIISKSVGVKCISPGYVLKYTENGEKKEAIAIACNPDTKWSAYKDDTSIDATSEITGVECVAAGYACHMGLINTDDVARDFQMDKFTEPDYELKCKLPDAVMKWHTESGEQKETTIIKCDKAAGKWKADGADTTIDAKNAIKVNCGTACDKVLIYGFVDAKMDAYTEPDFNLKCTLPNNVLKYTEGGKQKETPVMKCDKGAGKWRAGSDVTTIDATSLLTVECVIPDCDNSFITPDNTVDIRTPKELKCLKADEELEIDLKNYDKITCSATGWTNPTGPPSNIVKGARDSFKAKCVKKDCDISYIKDDDKLATAIAKELKCKDASEELQIESNYYDKITCNPGTGWVTGSSSTKVKGAKDPIAATCVKKACHKDLIDAGADTNVDKATDNQLKCKNLGGVLEIDAIQYPELKCDSAAGWTNPADLSKAKVKDARAPFNVKCVTKACHKDLITAGDSNVDKATDNILKCTNPGGELEIDGIQYLELECDSATGWTKPNDLSKAKVKDARAQFKAKCATKACHKDLITVVGSDVDKATDNILKCTSLAYELDIGGRKFDALVCTADDKGWHVAPDGDRVKPADEPFQATCVKKGPCSFNKVAAKLDNTKTPPTLTCNTDPPGSSEAPQMIKYKGKEYASLTCDGTNWLGEGLTELATTFLEFECVPYCITTDASVISDVDRTTQLATKSCNPEGALYHNGDNGEVRVDGDKVVCSWGDKWKAGEQTLSDKISEPLKLSCRKACNPWIDGLSDDIMDFGTVGNSVFKCKKPKANSAGEFVPKTVDDKTKYVIKLNGKFVFSHLKCDATNGYTDVAGVPLATAYDKVQMECADALCASISPIVCAAAAPIPEGYGCEDTNAKHSPFHITDDPNMPKCKELQRMYDNAQDEKNKKFIPYPLRCSDDKNWHKFDNPQETQEPNQLICLQLNCNKCEKLTGAADETYKKGDAENCATEVCPANLWKIKRVGGSAEEQYAGEVKCSSEGGATNKAMDSKWVDDDNIVIESGSCIPAGDHGTVSCLVASKLETKCTDEWTAKGCTEMALIDGDNVCAEKKNMFFKPKGFYGFAEEAKKIACVNGIWKVTTAKDAEVDLLRGGTVICADSNPAPTTTTLAPTTTTPFVDPCKVCPKMDTIMMKCKECDSNPDHIKTMMSEDKEVCLAFPEVFIDSKMIKTDQGSVDKLYCNKTNKYWAKEDGQEVKQVAAFQATEPESNLLLIGGGAVGGVILLIIVFAVIFVFVTKKRPEKDEETKKKILEESKRKKQKLGDNDDILDEVSVDAPSELKL